MSELAYDPLDSSAPLPTERQASDLHLIVSEALDVVRPYLRPNIDLREDLRTSIELVLADVPQIRWMVKNLCCAVAQTVRGQMARITVQLDSFWVDPQFAHAQANLHPGPYLRLSIAETAGNIQSASAHLKQTPMISIENPDRNGVHRVIKDHGGAIRFASREGEGTVVHVFFPRHEIGVPDSIVKAFPGLRGHGERILFVDDEVELCAAAETILTKLNYAPTTWTNALEALIQFRSEPNSFNLVFTDLLMPSINGQNLATELRRVRPDIPIVLMTGATNEWDLERVQKEGMSQLLNKPLTVLSLGEAAKKALQGRPGTSSLAS